jgi:hypothetical protein
VTWLHALSKPAAAARRTHDTIHQEAIMRYLLMICADESARISPADGAFIQRSTEAWVKEMDDRGVRLEGHRVRPVADATSVRVRDGDVIVTDGPFAEAKEQMAGYDIIECADLDEAIEVAAKHPMAQFGLIEVRPFWEE